MACAFGGAALALGLDKALYAGGGGEPASASTGAGALWLRALVGDKAMAMGAGDDESGDEAAIAISGEGSG